MDVFVEGDNEERQAELARRDEEMRHEVEDTLGARGSAVLTEAAEEKLHQQVMGGLREKATRRCLEELDEALQKVILSRIDLPEEIPVGAFGALSFEKDQLDESAGAMRVRFALKSGKLVDVKAILDYDQRLWAAYTRPSSLAVLLLPQDGGTPEVGEGPSIESGVLVWTIRIAALEPHWVKYQPRLDCFVADQEKVALRYAVGQAASSEGTAEPLAGGVEVVVVYIFSEQEEEGDLVVGVEWQPDLLEKLKELDFNTFKERLFGSLQEKGVAFTPVSEFPSSCRVYLRIAQIDRQRLEQSVERLNEQLNEY
jgi:hypothetical protein